MSGRLVILPVGKQPDIRPGEQIREVTKLTIDDRKPPPDTTRDSLLQNWLIEEMQSYNEARGVIEDYKLNSNPDKMSAHQLDELLIRFRGKGWGKWKEGKGPTLQGLALTTADFIDQKTLLCSYVDHVSIHQWYLTYRKRMLKLCLRYAQEPDITIEQFQTMNDKLKDDSAQSVPKPEALTTVAKQMIQESEKRPDQITDLLNKTLAAKEALFAAMNDLGQTVHGFKETTDNYSKDLHAFKSSVILDLSAAKKEMADVRRFFLEKDHVTEIDRLKEFLDLCDRFKKLKDAGGLDVITDCILKLEVK